MKLNGKMRKAISGTVESAVAAINLTELQMIFGGAPAAHGRKMNGPLPPIV